MYLCIKTFPQESVNSVVHRTSEATTTSQASVFMFLKESVSGTVQTPRKTWRATPYAYARNVRYNDFIRSAIRKIIYSYLLNN